MEVRILGEYVGLGERAVVLSVVFMALVGLMWTRDWLFISNKHMQDTIYPMALTTALITAHGMKYRFPAMGSWTRFHNEIEYQV